MADPQIIDPHSYPGRPWPINPLTMLITDNFMRRSYIQLQKVLHPDTVFFLGDLFDGGREWSAQGDVDDVAWGRRPEDERKYAQEWKENLGDDYWLSEYERFGNIFYDPWNLGGVDARPWQRGRKLISSLPGNHDLGFGDEIKPVVRDRFESHFGDVNRVDIIGNHTFVSVDSVSLSADTSRIGDRVDLKGIYGPTQDFLREVKAKKRRAIERELRFWRGEEEALVYEHGVKAVTDPSRAPTMDRGASGVTDFPTILLTHVPLYRDPGTPCGPFREHWPPAKPPKGQKSPVTPDHRNAIRVAGGYQYQNVLNDADSRFILGKIGNVGHAFSGDDHDYCEVEHTADQDNVLEITVKSFSMAMGIPTPGFQMVSLYNPVDVTTGQPLLGGSTLQTHLCLLPSQLHTYLVYTVLGLLTVGVLTARAALLPVAGFEPFALENESSSPTEPALPLHGKPKTEAYDSRSGRDPAPAFSGTTSASKSSSLSSRTTTTRTQRGLSTSSGTGAGGPMSSSSTSPARSGSPMDHSPGGAGRWGWNRGPRIQIRRDDLPYSPSYHPEPGLQRGRGLGGAGRTSWQWRPATAVASVARSRRALRVAGRELWTTVWRVVWMVLLFFAWVTYRG